MLGSDVSFVVPDPFNRFAGRSLIGLLIVFAAYTLWYVGPGYFGQLIRLESYSALQSSWFYSGQTAVNRLDVLDAAGRRVKYLALIFDVPYMILQALVFEALIAFGLRRAKPQNPKWIMLFILPITFLLVDFAEDSFLALTLVTGSYGFGAAAGFFTFLKMLTFIIAIIASISMACWGLWAWRMSTKI